MMTTALGQLLNETRAVLGAADRTTALRFLTQLLLKAPNLLHDHSLRAVDQAMTYALAATITQKDGG